MDQAIDREPLWATAVQSPDLSHVEYRVWSYLLWRQGKNGHCWPSQRTICADLGLSIQGLRNIIRRLADKRWLRAEWPDGPGRKHAYHYTVTCPEKVNGGVPFKQEKRSTAVDLSAEEKVNGESAKRSTAVDPNTIKGTHTSKNSLVARRLAELLLSEIRRWKPDLRQPNLDHWTKDIDLMLRRDGRTPEKVEAVIRWCQADSFWRCNVLSAAKLRKQYDAMDARRMTEGDKESGPHPCHFSGCPAEGKHRHEFEGRVYWYCDDHEAISRLPQDERPAAVAALRRKQARSRIAS